MFGYAIFYFVNSLDISGFVPSLIYFGIFPHFPTSSTSFSSSPFLLHLGYCAIICCFFFVLTGSLGFYASHWFVRKIYSAIRQD